MKPEILDTNVLLRFLVGDNVPQQNQAKQWFSEAQQGTRKIIIYPLVLAETAFVLESYYKLDRSKIANSLELFISQRWLIIQERAALLHLWQWYRQGLHFVDSFLIASAKNNNAVVLLFDQQLKKHELS